MPTEKLRTGFRLLCLAVVIAVPSAAFAHTVMMKPLPRDVGQPNSDAHKSGPCGAVPRTTHCTKYEAGAPIPVRWMETVDHKGCFQWVVSKANDTNFTMLKQINDPTGTGGMVYNDTLTLPAGYTCANCTLAVRQLMIGTCGPDAAPNSTSATDTYFSCADIRIGDFPNAAPCDPPVDPSAMEAGADASPEDSGVDSGVPTTPPTDDGGRTAPPGSGEPAGSRAPNLHSGDGGGCSVALGATSGLSFGVAAGLFGLALLRRRRKRAQGGLRG